MSEASTEYFATTGTDDFLIVSSTTLLGTGAGYETGRVIDEVYNHPLGDITKITTIYKFCYKILK